MGSGRWSARILRIWLWRAFRFFRILNPCIRLCGNHGKPDLPVASKPQILRLLRQSYGAGKNRTLYGMHFLRPYEYPKISPAVIVAITNKDKLLMSRYAHGTYRRFALIAGYVEIGETFEDCVRREVMEEVGLKVKNIRYYKSQPWAFSDTVMIGFTAELDGDDTIRLQEEELSEAGWYTREQVIAYEPCLSVGHEMMAAFKAEKSAHKSIERKNVHKMRDYLLFDLDGTLTDPKEGITKSVQYALNHYGIQVEDLERLIPFIGPPLMDSFQEFYVFHRAGKRGRPGVPGVF